MCQFPQTEFEHEILGNVKNIIMDEKQMTLGIIFHEIEPEIEDIICHYVFAIIILPLLNRSNSCLVGQHEIWAHD